jgi:cytochrome oxidase assembly protein ShyY1
MEPRAKPVGNEVVSRPSQRFAGLAIPVPTAATYDTVTEGKTGWRFVLTKRWIAFILGAVVYAAGCAAGVIWQAQLGQQIAQFNATVDRNFDAPAVPLADILPSLGAYSAAEQWKPVTATGSYLVSSQLYVRNRTCGADTGFEVLTPLRLSTGRIFVIDRGCVDSSIANPNDPSPAAPPPTGAVSVTARIVASEAAQGSVTANEADEPESGNQVDSIDLHELAPRLDAPTYTGAYGMLASQQPAPVHALHRVLTGKPTVDGSAQEGTVFATILYALVGLGIFGYALREKFRFVNRFDPRLWAKEWRRIQRLARKPYTDAEIEDLIVDGYPPARIALDISRAEGADGGRDRNRGEAVRAVVDRRGLIRGRLEPLEELTERHDDEEVDDGRNDDE